MAPALFPDQRVHSKLVHGHLLSPVSCPNAQGQSKSEKFIGTRRLIDDRART